MSKDKTTIKKATKTNFSRAFSNALFQKFFLQTNIKTSMAEFRTQSGVEGKMPVRKVERDEIKFVQAYHTTNTFFEA